jgi:hypothetical protein
MQSDHLLRKAEPHLQTAGGMPGPFEMKTLAGGLINHVWRITCLRSQKTCILKHAPPYVATNPSIELSQERIVFEKRALVAIANEMPEMMEGRLTVPRVLFYVEDAFLLGLSDFGEDSHDLMDAIVGEKVSSVSLSQEIGQCLGQWLRKLHEHAWHSSLAQCHYNTNVHAVRNSVCYAGIGEMLRANCIAGDAASLGEIAENLGRLSLNATAGCTLVMGDLWLRSILCHQDSRTQDTPTTWSLCCIDWEFSSWGLPWQDVGHCISHLWMLGKMKPALAPVAFTMLSSFLAAYAAGEGDHHRQCSMIDCKLLIQYAACEVLVRCIGPFAPGYLTDNVTMKHALAVIAASWLRESERRAVTFTELTTPDWFG